MSFYEPVSDPDDPHTRHAALKWAEFLDAAGADRIALLEKSLPAALLQRVISFSDFFAGNCIRSPRLLSELVQSGDLQRVYPQGHYDALIQKDLADCADDTSLGHRLCRIRRREMIRIAFRDLAQWADLSETLEDLSAFADACLQGALGNLTSRLRERYGVPQSDQGIPQQLVVIGMGKLGARELNFSSDVDLVFAYPEPGETVGGQASITNEEFFAKLCQRYVAVLGSSSPDGPLFRVDLRLRPFGESGPLVMSFDAMEEYFQSQGRDWERYAWIKARTVAGDFPEGERLLTILKSFVYRRYIDYTMFESFRDMKQKIERELTLRGIRENIKNGPGGIREVEFFGQIFQLFRGGVMPVLQQRGIVAVLEQLARENFIAEEVAGSLILAYEFLRKTENRLQEFSDRQTHVLPPEEQGRKCLAAAMGFHTWEEFKSALDGHRNFVHAQFHLLLDFEETKDTSSETSSGPDPIDSGLKTLWLGLDKLEEAPARELGFDDSGKTLAAITQFHQDPSVQSLGIEGRRRLDKLIPLLLRLFLPKQYPPKVLQDILDLIRAILRRTTYLSLLSEHPDALARLIDFSAASPWLIAYLARHPVLLDELLDPRTLFTPPTRADLSQDLIRRFKAVDPKDLEYQMEILRIFKHSNSLRVAAADISGALPLMKVSDHLSYIAEEVVSRAIDLSWSHLTEKHGFPICELSGNPLQRGFAVIAYGKLGGYELSYTSDLDLVFLHAGTPLTVTDGNHPIDTGQFFARLGQRVIHLLTTHTATGVLYDTDVRLRPSGAGGILVCHIDSFESYQQTEAWTWEHQALVRARAIWGDPALQERFEQIRTAVICRHREKKVLREEVADMRERISREHGNRKPETFDLKYDRGGIVDIEFAVQYIVLLMAHRYPLLASWTDNIRQIRCIAQCGLINDRTAHLLRTAYLTYRASAHRSSLQDRGAITPGDAFPSLRQGVTAVWCHVFGPE